MYYKVTGISYLPRINVENKLTLSIFVAVLQNSVGIMELEKKAVEEGWQTGFPNCDMLLLMFNLRE